MPIFLLLKLRWRLTIIAALISGFLIGVLPFAVYSWPYSPALRTTASIDGVTTVVDGIPTLAGWLNYLEPLGALGALGALGGLVFWLVLMLSARSSSRWNGNRVLACVGALAVASTVLIFLIPTITKDRTCHNMFRDERTMIRPQETLNLQIPIEDWPQLVTILEDFGKSHGWSFRNLSMTRPDGERTLYLSLCDNRGTNVLVTDRRLELFKYAPLTSRQGTGLSIYAQTAQIDWTEATHDLLTTLQTTWPDKFSVDKLDPHPPVPRAEQAK